MLPVSNLILEVSIRHLLNASRVLPCGKDGKERAVIILLQIETFFHPGHLLTSQQA